MRSLIERLLNYAVNWVINNPRSIFITHFILIFFSLFVTIKGLKVDFDRDNLVGANKKYHQLYLRYKEEFPVQNEIVTIIESQDNEKNRQFVERLARRMLPETNLFTDVFYKGDIVMMENKALLFLTEEELKDLYQTIKDYKPFLRQFARATNFVSLFNLVNTQFRTAKRELNSQTESLINSLPALERILKIGSDSLSRPGTPVSPGVYALFGGSAETENQMYITFGNGKMYLITARPVSSAVTADAISRLRELVEIVKLEVPGVNVGITGEPVLEYDEMVQSQKDSVIASIVAIVLCALIFIYGYEETGRPIKATICLLIGLIYTLAFTTLAIGHLNILTVTFVPILIGLGIDFGVHLVTRYEEELRLGHPELEAIRKGMINTGKGIFTGCLTTAGAFLAMGFTNFKGIQEMGLICGAGMILCLFSMMTLLPVLLLRGKQNVIDHTYQQSHSIRQYIESFWLSYPRPVVVGTIIATLIAGIIFSRVKFDYNLLNLQSHGLPAVEYEKKLINSATKSLLFAAVVASNLNEAVFLESQLTNLSTVANVESMCRFLVDNQKTKLELIGKIKEELADVQFLPPDPTPVNVWELSRILWSLRAYLSLAAEEAEQSDKKLANQLNSFRETIQEFRKQILSDPHRVNFKLTEYQIAFFNDIKATFDAIKNQDNSGPLTPDDFPKPLRNRFIGKTGKFLLQVYPKQDVWEREPQEAFVKELRSIVPDVTGTPVQLYEYTTLLKNSYELSAVYALIAILILLWVHFRNVSCIILALLPVTFGFIWMGGLMGVGGVNFNLANIMTLPLVIGIGVTNGIHILTRFSEEQTPAILTRSTGKAVIVSGLTTIAGFGSLMLGKHQGIISLGYIMSIGVAACMAIALMFLPSLISLLLNKGWKLNK